MRLDNIFQSTSVSFDHLFHFYLHQDFLVRGLTEKFDIPPGLVVSRGEWWKTSRQAISPTFTGGKIKQVETKVYFSIAIFYCISHL